MSGDGPVNINLGSRSECCFLSETKILASERMTNARPKTGFVGDEILI